jgi:hypothetical protein
VRAFLAAGLAWDALIERPITDIVLAEILIGSLTQAASSIASSALSFPSRSCSRVPDNVTFRKEKPHGFKIVCRRVALCGN